MAAVVEHDKRRDEILQKSVDVFMTEGYKDVTIQKIADHCGITRTTLYIYFKNKQEIFVSAIKKVTKELESELFSLVKQKELSCEETLKQMMYKIFQVCEKNSHVFVVITGYLQQLQKTGEDPNKRVMHHVLKLRHFTTQLLIKGIENGEFRKTDLKNTNELFYSIIEALIFRIVVLNQHDLAPLYGMIDSAVENLKA